MAGHNSFPLWPFAVCKASDSRLQGGGAEDQVHAEGRLQRGRMASVLALSYAISSQNVSLFGNRENVKLCRTNLHGVSLARCSALRCVPMAEISQC
jgi:hypothetical protein